MDLSGPRLGRTLKLLHRKLWQNAVLYDEHDRCASVYQPADRADRTQKLACLVTIFQQPPTPPQLLPLSGTDRGDTGSRVFV